MLIVGILHAYSTSVSEQIFAINFGEAHYCLFCYLFLVVSNLLVLLFANCWNETLLHLITSDVEHCCDTFFVVYSLLLLLGAYVWLVFSIQFVYSTQFVVHVYMPF